MQTEQKILCQSGTDLSPVETGTVQLVVTSPPYPMIEMWDACFMEQDPEIKRELEQNQGWQAYEKMHRVLDRVWQECDRVLQTGGFICINIGDATRTIGSAFQMYPNHCRITQFFADRGYSVLPDLIWRKPTNSPNKFMGSGMYPAGAYVTYEHEHILILRKGENVPFPVQQGSTDRRALIFGRSATGGFPTCGRSEVKGRHCGRSMDVIAARPIRWRYHIGSFKCTPFTAIRC